MPVMKITGIFLSVLDRACALAFEDRRRNEKIDGRGEYLGFL